VQNRVHKRKYSKTVMPHGTTNMPRVEGPTESLGASICRIDSCRDVDHADETKSTPLLNGKVLNDVNMTRTCGRLVFDMNR
jgi:hypothetical protein